MVSGDIIVRVGLSLFYRGTTCILDVIFESGPALCGSFFVDNGGLESREFQKCIGDSFLADLDQ